jgi:hypothetical protein
MADLITKRTPYDWVLEFLSWIGVFFALMPLRRYNEIPDKALVPVHFDFRGVIDAWGNKEYILCYSFLAIFFFILMFLLEKNYKILNYPIKVTDNNKFRLYKLGVKLVRHLKLIVVCLFSYLANMSFYVSMGSRYNGKLPILFMISILLITLAFFFVKMIKLKRLL